MDKKRDMTKSAEYMRNQVTELLTNYVKIDILWLDFPYSGDDSTKPWMKFDGGKGKDQWEAEKLIKCIRNSQEYPFGPVTLPDIYISKIEYAQFLSDGSEVLFNKTVNEIDSGGEILKTEKTGIDFTLPPIAPKGISPVIEVFLK